MDVLIAIVVIGIALWLSLKLLKFLFIGAKKAIGWIGPYVVAAIPAAGAYIVTTALFGVGVKEASITGFLTALFIGAVMNNVD